MTELLTPDDVEDRLRRTFAARADDLAAGPGDERLVVPPGPTTEADGGDDRLARTASGGLTVVPLDRVASPARRRGATAKRTLAVAAAAVTIGGVAAVVQMARSDPGDGTTVGTTGPMPNAGALETCAPWMSLKAAAIHELWPDAVEDPNAAQIAFMRVIEALDPTVAHQLSAAQETATPLPSTITVGEMVDVGGNAAWYRTTEGSDEESVKFLSFNHGDLRIEIYAAQVREADMFAFAESLQRQPDGSWEYLVPPGLESDCGGPHYLADDGTG